MVSAQFLCLSLSLVQRGNHVGQAGCTPPPAASSIPEDVFSASARGLSMDGQQKGQGWDRGALCPDSSPG